MKIALASKSPRRRELIAYLGWDVQIIDAHIIERLVPNELPRDTALRLAVEKSVAGSVVADPLPTIGADTVVDVNGTLLGKPVSREDAARMLRMLSGKHHFVHTGIAISKKGQLLSKHVETTMVFFGKLTDDDIERFISTGEADDKAGAYSAQGAGALFIEKIEGCFYNVVGLPIYALKKMASVI